MKNLKWYLYLYHLIPSSVNNLQKMTKINYSHKLLTKPNLKTIAEYVEKLAEDLFSSKLFHFYVIVYLLTFGIYILLGGTFSKKLQSAITLCLLCLEICHGLLHMKVLFALGKMANEAEYQENRSYFIIDGLSCVSSYLCLRSFHPDLRLSHTAALALGLDIFIHFYFVMMWKVRTEAVIGVMRWSSLPFLQRCTLVDVYNNLRFFGGSGLDTSVHFYLAYNLFQQFKTILNYSMNK